MRRWVVQWELLHYVMLSTITYPRVNVVNVFPGVLTLTQNSIHVQQYYYM